MKWRIPLSEPSLGEQEVEAAARVIRSKWLTMGPETETFERQFGAKLGVNHSLAVSSCTAALHISMAALGIGPGDEVICPALTFVATANAVRYCGATPIFADVVSPSDWTISPVAIRAAISARTKAIAVVHYGGFACHMDDILATAREYGLLVIEDCAHAPFASYHSSSGSQSHLGTLGDVGCFSFFSNKNMTTGEGGMITTNRAEVAAECRLLRSHGMTSLTADRHRGHANGYDVIGLGYNYRIDEIRSAIGICQLQKVDELNSLRRQVTSWYRDALRNTSGVTVPFADRELADSACHIFPVLVNDDPQGLRSHLAQAGIQTSRHYDLIPRFKAYADTPPFRSVVDSDKIITLPLGPSMTKHDVDEIADLIGQKLDGLHNDAVMEERTV